MSNLTDLVPPLELCKKIPAGEFADSALVCWDNKGEIAVGLRDKYGEFDIFFPVYPAPTTDEILDACNNIPGVMAITFWYQAEMWIADCAYNRTEKPDEKFLHDEDFDNIDAIVGAGKTPATAALKVWLKMKGIENE